MKKTILNLSLLSLVAIFAIGNCKADSYSYESYNPPVNTNSHTSIYFDGSVGLGTVNLNANDYNNPTTGLPPTEFSNYGFAWNADLGFQFNRYIAIEAGYISFGEANANTTVSIYEFPITAQDSFGGLDIMAKGILPLANHISIFGKVGAADMNDNFTASGAFYRSETGITWTPLIGLGLSYQANRNLSLNLQDYYSISTDYQKDGYDLTMPALNAILVGVSCKINI